MKLDFNAPFERIRQRLEARPKPDTRAQQSGEFSTLLSHIAPNKSQVVNNSEESSKAQVLEQKDNSHEKGPMASFNHPSPAPLIPKALLMQTSSIERSLDNEVPVSVKTPTLLEAKRVDRSPRSSISNAEVHLIIKEAAKKHGLDPSLSLAVAAAESSFDVNAVSRDGFASKGLFQLLDSTGQDMLRKLELEEDYDPFNPKQNANLGNTYLRYLHDLFNTSSSLPNGAQTFAAANSSSLENLALAAYNAGEGRVSSAQERAKRMGKDPSDYAQVESYLPETTQKYVSKIANIKPHFFD